MHGLDPVYALVGVLIVMSVEMARIGRFTFQSLQYLQLKLHFDLLRNHFSTIRPELRKILNDEDISSHVKNSFSINRLFKLLDKISFLKMRQSNCYLYLHPSG